MSNYFCGLCILLVGTVPLSNNASLNSGFWLLLPFGVPHRKAESFCSESCVYTVNVSYTYPTFPCLLFCLFVLFSPRWESLRAGCVAKNWGGGGQVVVNLPGPQSVTFLKIEWELFQGAKITIKLLWRHQPDDILNHSFVISMIKYFELNIRSFFLAFMGATPYIFSFLKGS